MRCFDHIIIYTYTNYKRPTQTTDFRKLKFLEVTSLTALKLTKKGLFEIRPLTDECEGRGL